MICTKNSRIEKGNSRHRTLRSAAAPHASPVWRIWFMVAAFRPRIGSDDGTPYFVRQSKSARAPCSRGRKRTSQWPTARPHCADVSGGVDAYIVRHRVDAAAQEQDIGRYRIVGHLASP